MASSGSAEAVICCVSSEEGKTLIEIPLTLGVVGALLLPMAAALGTIAALVTDCTIIVERVEDT